MIVHNGLHKGTACLVRAVCNLAEQKQTPYVTFRCARNSLAYAYLSEQTGGSWQRREREWTEAQTRPYRADLWAYAAAVRS